MVIRMALRAAVLGMETARHSSLRAVQGSLKKEFNSDNEAQSEKDLCSKALREA